MNENLRMEMKITYICHPKKLTNGSVVQLVRMPPCHGGGRGFESRPVRKFTLKALFNKAFFISGLI